MREIIRLAWADLRVDWPFALCQALALAAVLGPLLVLFGLREGVVTTLIQRLERDPAMRLITPEAAGSRRYDADWLARIRARPDVAFVMPSTRFIAGQVDLVAGDGEPLRVSLLPTGAGDPATDGMAPLADPRDVRLSAAAAERMRVRAGDRLRLLVERSRDGRVEPAALDLRVDAVTPAGRVEGRAALVTLELLSAVERYRDGFAVPALDWAGDPPPPEAGAWPLFRLHARSIEDVAGLVRDLTAEGTSVVARTAEIASALALRRNLTVVLVIVVALAVSGYLVALAAAQWGAALRKRREIAVLALVGYPPSRLALFPVVQGMVIAAGGAVAAAMLFAAVATVINGYFAAGIAADEVACRLTAGQVALASAATILLSIPPALGAGRVFARLEPSEELRLV